MLLVSDDSIHSSADISWVDTTRPVALDIWYVGFPTGLATFDGTEWTQSDARLNYYRALMR
jgi:hypothetical protein